MRDQIYTLHCLLLLDATRLGSCVGADEGPEQDLEMTAGLVSRPSQSADGSPAPVLLCFPCGPEGLQHAEILHAALHSHHANLVLLDGFDIFSVVQKPDGDPMLFHGSQVAACAQAWKTKHQDNQDPLQFVTALQMQLQDTQGLETAYAEQLAKIVNTAKSSYEAYSEFANEADSLADAFKPFLRHLWPTEKGQAQQQPDWWNVQLSPDNSLH